MKLRISELIGEAHELEADTEEPGGGAKEGQTPPRPLLSVNSHRTKAGKFPRT